MANRLAELYSPNGNLVLLKTTASNVLLEDSSGLFVASDVEGALAEIKSGSASKAHNLVDTTNHPVTGLTTGHVLRATGATTYGFGALQVTDLPSHTHSYLPLSGGTLTGDLALDIANLYIDGATGGWSRGFIFRSNDHSVTHTMFGGYGGNNTFSYAFIGPSYNNSVTRFYPDGKVAVGNHAPNALLHVGASYSSISGLTPHAIFGANVDAISTVHLENNNAGTSAEMRFIAKADDGAYLAFTQPSAANPRTDLFGVTGGLGSFIFSYGGATPRSLVVGTAENTDLILGTNRVSRVWVKNDGKVGIGTAAPVGKFHVNGGSIAVAAVADANPAVWTSDVSGSRAWVHSGGQSSIQFNIGTSYDNDSAAGFYYSPGTIGAGLGMLIIGQLDKNNANWTHGVTTFKTNGTEKMRIDKDGKVGIGTTSPAATLHVQPTGSVYGMIIEGGGLGSLRWGSGAQGHLSWDTDKVIVGGLANNALELWGGNGLGIKITTDQKVGVRTTAPLTTFQIGADTVGEEGTLGTLIPVARILGPANNTTDATILRLGRPTNPGQLYNTNVDFKIKSYGAMGSPFLPKTQFTIALKSGGSYAENANVDVMTLRDNGNVGIGTLAPAQKLHVNGSAEIDGSVFYDDVSRYWLATGTSWNYGLYWDTTTDQLCWYGGGTRRGGMDLNDGNMDITGSLTFNGYLQSNAAISAITLTGGAQRANVGQLLVSDLYSGVTVPTNGIYSKGDIVTAGDLTVGGSDIYITDTNTKITEGSTNSVRIQTNSGYVDIGPQNVDWCHIETDRAAYWFNKPIQVSGGVVGGWTGSLQLQANMTTALTLGTDKAAVFESSVVTKSWLAAASTMNTTPYITIGNGTSTGGTYITFRSAGQEGKITWFDGTDKFVITDHQDNKVSVAVKSVEASESVSMGRWKLVDNTTENSLDFVFVG